MQVTFELTQNDLSEAMIAHRNSRRVLRVFVAIALVMACWSISAAVRSRRLLDALPPVAFVAVTAWAWWALPHRQARRLLRTTKWMQGPQTILLDSAGVHWERDGGSSDTAWKNFIRYRESKSQFLPYTSPTGFNALPKRVLSSQQIVQVRSLLAESIAEPTRG